MKTAEQRKTQSIEKLKEQSIPYIDWLPTIGESTEYKGQFVENIVRRAIACLLVIQVACDQDNGNYDKESQDFFEDLLTKYGVKNYLTEKEKQILNNKGSEYDIINMVWKYEAYWVLVWALGLVDELDYPDHIVNCDLAIDLVRRCDTFDDFMGQTQPKDLETILDEADLYYRYHWACVDARIKEKEAPCDLDESVVLERRSVLDWLINYEGEADWDYPDLNT